VETSQLGDVENSLSQFYEHAGTNRRIICICYLHSLVSHHTNTVYDSPNKRCPLHFRQRANRSPESSANRLDLRIKAVKKGQRYLRVWSPATISADQWTKSEPILSVAFGRPNAQLETSLAWRSDQFDTRASECLTKETCEPFH
jgi:hypothetical protein